MPWRVWSIVLHDDGVVVIQRVRVRWTADGRGARAASLRRGLPSVYPLPELPDASLVVHDVLLDEAVDYQPSMRLLAGEDHAQQIGLRVEIVDPEVAVHRLEGSWGTYPRSWQMRTRLFTLGPGGIGRYRANLRDHVRCCSSTWYYEQRTIHVAHAKARTDLFLTGHPAHDIDDQVHLYGGDHRRSFTTAPRRGPTREKR